jgi:hypothetical protein
MQEIGEYARSAAEIGYVRTRPEAGQGYAGSDDV